MDAATTSEAIDIACHGLERPGPLADRELRGQLAAAASWIDAGEIDRAADTCQEALAVAMREEIPGWPSITP